MHFRTELGRTFVDISVFITLLILSFSFPWLVKGTFLDNILAWTFVVVTPIAIFFGIRKKKNWRKIIIGSLVFGTLFGAILEFVAHLTLAWQVPNSVFPFRIFGVSSFEALIFYAPMALFVLVFYEHFFDKDINHHISPNIWHAVLPGLLALFTIFVLYFKNPSKLVFSHPYLKWVWLQ